MKFLERIPGRVYDVTVFGGIILFAAFMAFTSAHAAAPSKQKEPGCTIVGTVGTIIESHCVDENGFEFEANSAGMMIPAE